LPKQIGVRSTLRIQHGILQLGCGCPRDRRSPGTG
jgi:hypothetical protein